MTEMLATETPRTETPQAETLLNWAGNLTYSAARLHRPETIEEVQAVVARAEKIRALGSRHSFNDVADTPHDLVSLERLNRVIALDRERAQVTVEGGIRYGELGRFLRAEGFALPNLASLPHISVAGACATATHGSGVGNGNLATPVAGVEFVRPDGEIVALSRKANPETFPGAVVALGGLGPVVRLTLDLRPTFDIAQTVYEGLPLATALAHYEEIAGRGYSVSLFTRWRGEGFEQVWVKRRADDPEAWSDSFYGAPKADGRRTPVPDASPVHTTDQGGLPGPWDDRLPHFRLEFTPSSGEELQSEYILPRAHAPGALAAVDALRERIAPLLQVCEVRTVAADDLWMSPSYRSDSVCLHFTWRPLWPEVRALLPDIEAALAPFGPRPHWGKLATMPPADVRVGFPRLPDFLALLRTNDPGGKFRNPYLDRMLFDPI